MLNRKSVDVRKVSIIIIAAVKITARKYSPRTQ